MARCRRLAQVPASMILILAANCPAAASGSDGDPQLSIVEYPPTTSSTTVAFTRLEPGSPTKWSWQLVSTDRAGRATNGQRVTDTVSANAHGQALLRLHTNRAGTYLIRVSGISATGSPVAATTSITVTADDSGGAESDLTTTDTPTAENSPASDAAAVASQRPEGTQPAGALAGFAALALATGIVSVGLGRRWRTKTQQLSEGRAP